ncbi:hypothetical protein SADUNF_Sadunf13G0014000 [Salix dunnii]|uniref:RRM domain-containing protein n=1 Tax=Salix dunnii TaxID=1413687 RepID=A0A835JHQ6_9ROSI|nr:hypothetical protein SADUNF_Sadunf13G0014000 [Salix dunnii]
MKFNNVYVKNSVESTIDECLKDVFTKHGAKSKCFEFVNFEKAEDADEVVKTLDGKEIEGKECYVGKWYMKTGGATFEGNPDGFVIGDDDVLRFGNRLYVPDVDDLKRELMTEAHQIVYTVHPGSTKMYKDLKYPDMIYLMKMLSTIGWHISI